MLKGVYGTGELWNVLDTMPTICLKPFVPPHALNYPWPWGASAFLTSRSCSIGSDHRGVWIPSGRNRFAERAGAGTAPTPCARGWADRNISREATSLWFYTATLTSRQGIFLQKVVHSMGKGLLLQEIMKRKRWKSELIAMKTATFFKRFLYGWFWSSLGVLFYFMSIVIVRNVIVLFECECFISKHFFF